VIRRKGQRRKGCSGGKTPPGGGRRSGWSVVPLFTRAKAAHLHVVAAQVLQGVVPLALLAIGGTPDAEKQGEDEHAQKPHGLPPSALNWLVPPPPYSHSGWRTQEGLWGRAVSILGIGATLARRGGSPLHECLFGDRPRRAGSADAFHLTP